LAEINILICLRDVSSMVHLQIQTIMLSSQVSFVDGLDFLSSDIQISQFGYQWLVNARQRFGYIQANKAATDWTRFAPAGKLQGIKAVGSTLILFANGKAYFQFNEQTFWQQIGGFQMDASVDKLYAEFVPDSTFNFSRALNSTLNIADPIVKKANVSINGTPQGLLVQDGINQPYVITFDGNTNLPSARVTQTYEQWLATPTQQEYIPIGTLMLYVAPKLYIVSADRKVIYQSISGRPLDFMINVDVDGNKLATEDLGGAFTVSFAFDFDEITCLATTNIPDSFYIASRVNSRIITLDYTRTVFGEPQFNVAVSLSIGAVNENSFLDILGDYSIIDSEGIKSFNAVQQYKVQGKNSIFSLKLQRLLQLNINKVIQQQTPCCVMFNDCAIYSIKTTMGNILVVYDTILNKWVSLDITECSKVKQFATINVNGIDKKLYAITYYNEIFQLYSSDDDETACLFTRALTYNQNQIETGQGSSLAVSPKIKTEFVKTLFDGGSYDTECTVTEYVDGSKGQALTKDLKARLAGISPPISPPVIPSSLETCVPLTYSLNQGLNGNKIAYTIQWKSDAKLLAFELQTLDDLPVSGNIQNEETLTSAN
jgi:hypothetical protein